MAGSTVIDHPPRQSLEKKTPFVLLLVLFLVVVMCLGGLVQSTAIVPATHCFEDATGRSEIPAATEDQQKQLARKMVGKQRGRLEPFPVMPNNVSEALAVIQANRNKNDGERGTFIQIGANNGVLFDPIFKPMKHQKDRWVGLLVEPQPMLYSKLTVVHADAPHWSFYQGAVTPGKACTNGTILFCETKTPGQGNFMKQGQLNTINKKRCKLKIMHYVRRPCVSSFEKLIQYHANSEFMKEATTSSGKFIIDLLQTDVESQDFEILKLLDFDLIRPQCINYESRGLFKDKKKSIKFLKNKGYTVKDWGSEDTLACLVDTNQSSTK